MKKQCASIVSVALSVMVFMSICGCSSEKTKLKLNQSIGESASDTSATEDEFEVEMIDSSSDSSNTSEINASSPKKTTIYIPGEDKVVDPDSIKLPDLKITNKTVKLMTRGENLDTDCQKILKEKYGITVSTQIVANDQFNSTFISLVSSGKSPDIAYTDYYPSFVGRNLVQTIGSDMVDFSTPLWEGVKQNNQPFTINGKYYYVSPAFRKYQVIWYNKKMFEQAGIKTPMQQYYAGTWNWNTYKDAAKKLAQDTNNDGTPEVYGFGVDDPELLLYTTGKHIISFNQDGTATDNIDSEEMARFTAFNIDMVKNSKQYPGNTRLALAQDKVAMGIGSVWWGMNYKDQIANGTLEFAPVPRDPSADKYYVAEEGSGWYIPVGASNVVGAAAVLNALRYENIAPEYFVNYYDKVSATYGNWTTDMKNVFIKENEMEDTVFQNWVGFNIGQYWGTIFSSPINGVSWSSVVAEVKPKIDHQIELYYEN